MMYTKENKDAPNIMHLINSGSRGAEIGVWRGNTSKKFVERGVAELHLVDPYSVEPYKNSSEMSFEEYLAKYQKITGEFSEAGFTRYYDLIYTMVRDMFVHLDHVTVHRKQSSVWFEENRGLDLDWIYIDGDHSYEGCLADLESALSVVKSGGMILGDDYYWPDSTWGKEGVTKAVDKFISKHNFKIKRYGMTQFKIEV